MSRLYICGTPIGNLEDVTLRLLRILKEVDLIACEDTRHTLKLLNFYNINNKLISYHEHSSTAKEEAIINMILSGKSVALVTDAGMPGISDPGQRLIAKAVASNIPMEIVPGPSALLASLAISGLDTQSFVFAGFLPRAGQKRHDILKQLEQEKRTVILYEAPHRLLKSLQDIEEMMGADRGIVVARELTKKHEEIVRGCASEVRAHFEKNTPMGEICILISGRTVVEEIEMSKIIDEVDLLIKEGLNKNEAFKLKAREYKVKKSDIYKYFTDRE